MDYMDRIREAPLLLDFGAQEEALAIATVTELLMEHPVVTDPRELLTAIMERQRIQPPLLGNGIALPHARSNSVTDIAFAIGRCRQSVPFGVAGEPIRLIFLYASPPGLVAQSLATIAALVGRLRKPGITAGLLASTTEAEFRNWLA